jgi:hypothetical protein
MYLKHLREFKIPMYKEQMWELCTLAQTATLNSCILITLVEPVHRKFNCTLFTNFYLFLFLPLSPILLSEP